MKKELVGTFHISRVFACRILLKVIVWLDWDFDDLRTRPAKRVKGYVTGMLPELF